jgi:hypothetical protein
VLNPLAFRDFSLISNILGLKFEEIMIYRSDIQQAKSLFRLIAHEKYVPAITL